MVADCDRAGEVGLRGLVQSLAAGAAAVLAGCVTDDGASIRSGSWRIDQRPDRITGTPVAGAFTATSRATNSYILGPDTAVLQLTCFEQRPIVKITFHFKIGSDRNTSLGYRFDDRPGRDSVESRVLLGSRVIVIEDGAAVQQFVSDLRGSAQLFVRIRSLNAGTTAAEFKVDGSEPAIEAAYASCPPPAQQARRTS